MSASGLWVQVSALELALELWLWSWLWSFGLELMLARQSGCGKAPLKKHLQQSFRGNSVGDLG